MFIWINGELKDQDLASIPCNDRGFTLGDGVFDTMLANDGVPVWPNEHFARLTYNASVFGIEFTLEFEKTARALLDQNGLTQGRYAIRTTITRGAGARGLNPPEHGKATVLMTAAPAPEKKHRAELVIAETVRRNEFSPLSHVKSLNYGDNILAVAEAREKGAEDAIMLNTAGHVCCATTSNIFIREGDKLLTPPLSDGVLSGITRQKIIDRHPVTEESFKPEKLFEADAVFLTNSIQGVRPVKRIDHTYFREYEEFILGAIAA